MLSSTEAEYVAISEAAKKVRFVCYLLNDLHIKVKLLILVRTDNIGAIFMSENELTCVITLSMSLLKTVLSRLNLFGLLEMMRTER